MEHECGFVVDVGDLNAICDGIIRIMKIGSEKFKRACVNRAENFEKNFLIEKTYKLYETMIKS